MKKRICLFACGTLVAIFGLSAANATDDEVARDLTQIEMATVGGTKVTVVEGTDSRAAGETAEVASFPAPSSAGASETPAEMPAAMAVPHKARLAVLPAVFSKHFHPVLKFSEKIELSGQTNLKMIFTAEHESRMEAPSFTLSLTEAFVGSRKFDVLERSRLNETLKEIDFGESDYADAAKAVPMGKALNAEYVVLSDIEVIELVAEAKDVPYVDTIQPTLSGKMIVRLRVVDTASTKVTAACTEEVQVERKLKANSAFLESEIHNLMLDLYAAASLRSLHRTLESIYPVRLLDVADGKAVLNRGEGAIRLKDEFNVYSLGKAYPDPDTGEMLGQSETKVAKIIVNRIGPKFSEAEIVEGADRLAGDLGGFLCRETDQSIEAKTRIEQKPIAW